MEKDAYYWIKKLDLKEHPEGGYFKETYRCDEAICADALPKRFTEEKTFCTAIYFLLKGNQTSYFHRLKADELWHFYCGSSLTLHVINKYGNYTKIHMGRDFENGEVFQGTVKHGDWFGATVDDKTSYSLLGCTVSPGFSFNDFEIADKNHLIKIYPERALIIKKISDSFF